MVRLSVRYDNVATTTTVSMSARAAHKVSVQAILFSIMGLLIVRANMVKHYVL
jgi:hypothetical protein